jgi:hypothetical protein
MLGSTASRRGALRKFNVSAVPNLRVSALATFALLAAICAANLAIARDAVNNRDAANTAGAQGLPTVQFRYGEPHTILTDEGPISFGMIVSVEVVSWSAPDAMDLLISRCWDGIYLYPSKDLKEIGVPIHVCTMRELGPGIHMARTADCFPNEPSTIIVADRKGNLTHLRKVGEFPDLKLKKIGAVKDAATGHAFNIPFDNPNYKMDSAGGYIKLDYFNYVYPLFYPTDKGEPPALMAGDWAGRMWWMPQTVRRDRRPVFAGASYKKSDGKSFAKPKFEATDENGKPLLLGFTVEKGKRYDGGVTRPIYYKGDHTGTDDLIVQCGTGPNEQLYLQGMPATDGWPPRFKNLGPIQLEGGGFEAHDQFAYHSMIAVFRRDGWNQLLVSRGSNLAVFENKKMDADVPAFRFSHWLSGRDVPLRGWNYTEILRSESGKKYLLDNDNEWWFRELRSDDKGVRVSSKSHPLYDQNGVFHVPAETDPTDTRWGFHRAALWDFDGSGKQHLIVGTDCGNLYLLRQDKPLGVNDRFEFTSFGPLTDSAGKVIKIHNRVDAGPIDLDGDGRVDLVLGGNSYQLGVYTDPTPGGGLYYALNRGVDAKGLPILDPVRPLETVGHKHSTNINEHHQIQVLDLMGDGRLVVIVGTKDDRFRGHAYRPATNRVALEPTGLVLPPINIEEHLLDLDGDGDWEYVKSGSESLIGTYADVVVE